MMLLSMNTYLTLLCGVSALFSVKAVSVTSPQTNGRNSTAESNDAATQLSTSHVLLNYESQTQIATPGLTRKPVATAETAASNGMETQEADVRSAGYGSNVSTTASSWPHVYTSATEATPSHNKMTSDTAQPEPTTSTRMSNPATTTLMMSTSSAASLAAAVSSLQSTSTTEPEATHESSSTNSSSAPRSMQSFTTSSASTVSANTTNRTSEAAPGFDPTSSSETKPQTAATEPAATHESSSTNSSAHLTLAPRSVQSFTTSSASTVSVNTTNRTSEAAPGFDPTSSSETKPQTAATRDKLSSTLQPVSDAQTPTSTSRPPDSTRSASPTTSDSITAFSTSPAGSFIRPVPKLLPVLTTKSAAIATAAPEASQSPSPTEVQPCSSRGVVRQCLIIIASLAGLATVFMVSTIVLCAKLSARKHKAKKPKQETEMMCISALLPERNYTYTRQHNPVPNGVRVLPMGADSDDDMGDNLTLSSFLPENERIV